MLENAKLLSLKNYFNFYAVVLLLFVFYLLKTNFSLGNLVFSLVLILLAYTVSFHVTAKNLISLVGLTFDNTPPSFLTKALYISYNPFSKNNFKYMTKLLAEVPDYHISGNRITAKYTGGAATHHFKESLLLLPLKIIFRLAAFQIVVLISVFSYRKNLKTIKELYNEIPELKQMTIERVYPS